MTAKTNPYQEQIERLLKEARVNEPPIPVDRIARQLGAQLHRGALPDSLSGFFYRQDETGQPIIGVNSLHATVRQRFTIAHEIGHFQLHKQEFYVDRIHYRSAKSSKTHEPQEVEANQFAAELLMPAKFLKRDIAELHLPLDDEEVVADLAKRYQVSTHALVLRLVNLGFVAPI